MPWSPLRRAVVFDASVFHARVRLTVLAHDLAWRHAELQAGGQLWIRANTADLTGTEFLRGSILANPGHDTALPDRSDPGPKPADFDQLPLRDRAKYEARRAGHDLATRLAAQPPVAARVVSLRQANVAELVLSAVSLEECWFAGAHGLDKLRIDASCALPDSPAGWRRRRPFRFTDRRCLAEEAAWRHRHATWSATPDREEAGDPPPAMEIAGIYRDLRKGLEDIKNEPGAADFYYGEMEMRRLAARERNRPTRGGADGGVAELGWRAPTGPSAGCCPPTGRFLAMGCGLPGPFPRWSLFCWWPPSCSPPSVSRPSPSLILDFARLTPAAAISPINLVAPPITAFGPRLG